jgi:hypothetical protein|tara:strand:+ start:218 stop:445 length:228 start_codon:yes stop_codon:yes gene_type:complete
MTVTERRLRKLSEWLKESPSNVDSHHDGQLEMAIKYANQQVKQEIGDMLEEILDISDKRIEEEINEFEKCSEGYE